MADSFQAQRAGLIGPADTLLAVAPDDAADLPGGLTRAIYVGAGGDVAVIDRHGVETVFLNVEFGALLPIRVARVKATGTTAQHIVALY